jgi:hypothetical protein
MWFAKFSADHSLQPQIHFDQYKIQLNLLIIECKFVSHS